MRGHKINHHPAEPGLSGFRPHLRGRFIASKSQEPVDTTAEDISEAAINKFATRVRTKLLLSPRNSRGIYIFI